jgi:S1-C subfamily serine protease
MGRGHTLRGAVPHQLRALGIDSVTVLLAHERGADCERLAAVNADGVFGVEPPRATARTAPPRLGVTLAADGAAVLRIEQVASGSIAERAGLRSGDVLVTIAGLSASTVADVQRIVARQAPGTWLPIKVRRESAELELVAKFPAQ